MLWAARKMLKRILGTFFLITFWCCSAGCYDKPKAMVGVGREKTVTGMTPEYAKINELITNLVSFEKRGRENVIAAREHFNEMLMRKYDLSPSEGAAWMQFTDLEGPVLSECSSKQLAVLQNNIRDSGLDRYNKLPNIVRIHNVINQYLIKHAKYCASEYRKILRDQGILLDSLDRNLPEIFAKQLYIALGYDESKGFKFLPNDKRMRGFIEESKTCKMGYLAKALMQAFKVVGNQTEQDVVNKKDRWSIESTQTVSGIASKAFETCSTYASVFEVLVDLAEFDASTLELDTYGSEELTRTWVTVNVCRGLVSRDKVALTGELVKQIGTGSLGSKILSKVQS